jgi:hypothetical protein
MVDITIKEGDILRIKYESQTFVCHLDAKGRLVFEELGAV